MWRITITLRCSSGSVASAAYRSRAVSDQVRGALGDGDRRRVRVPARNHRHHRRVDDAQALEAVDAQLIVDDGLRVLAHAAGADGVIDGEGRARDRVAHRLVAVAVGRRERLGAVGRIAGWRADVERQAHAAIIRCMSSPAV
jgi:hypothetical protein